MKAPVGKLKCPLSVMAGEPHEAEVYVQAGKKGSRYWRCACGTMQPLLPDGQALLRRVYQPLDLTERDDAAKQAGADAEAEARAAARREAKTQSPIATFFRKLMED